ncbi:MAG TPA: VTT domain-containing protein [Vicinamibacteria bacterium]|jgi:membrane protein YqaA with SNARE-associated domain
MESLAESLDAFVRGLSSGAAGLGLFAIAFFDSSLLSLPEINDALLLYFGARFPRRAFYYASMTMLGSVTGASLLYGLARWKGFSFLEKRFPTGRLQSVFTLVGRYGALAVLVPSILPPPFPFKIFVLSSGALGLSIPRFLAAIAVGRSVRYFGEAWLAVRYGDEALSYLHANAGSVLIVALVLAAAALLVHLFRSRRALAETRNGGR